MRFSNLPGPTEVLHFKGDLTGAKGYAEDAVKLSVSQLAVFVGRGNPWLFHGFSREFRQNGGKSHGFSHGRGNITCNAMTEDNIE